MFYAICEGDPGSSTSPPFRFYKFKTLEEMRHCSAINEYSIVYNGESPRQLAEFCTIEELDSILRSFGERAQSSGSDLHILRNLHEFVVAKAITWKPEKETVMSDITGIIESIAPAAPVAPVAPAAPIKTESSSRPRFSKNAKIVCLVDEPPIRAGTNRYRNMLVVMQSATVGEAIETLRSLSPAPGGGVDVKIAIKAGAIELEE